MVKLLIVEDDVAIRHVLATFLTEEGFQVTTACDGQAGLDILRQEGGWVVLLDLLMPRVTGYEVLKQIQQDPRLVETNQVIVMSASWRVVEEGAALLHAPVRATLCKPFDLEQVLQVVQAASNCPGHHPN